MCRDIFCCEYFFFSRAISEIDFHADFLKTLIYHYSHGHANKSKTRPENSRLTRIRLIGCLFKILCKEKNCADWKTTKIRNSYVGWLINRFETNANADVYERSTDDGDIIAEIRVRNKNNSKLLQGWINYLGVESNFASSPSYLY